MEKSLSRSHLLAFSYSPFLSNRKKNNKKRIFDLQWAVFPPYIFSMNLLKITDTNGFNNFAEKQYLKLFIHLRILTQGQQERCESVSQHLLAYSLNACHTLSLMGCSQKLGTQYRSLTAVAGTQPPEQYQLLLGHAAASSCRKEPEFGTEPRHQ